MGMFSFWGSKVKPKVSFLTSTQSWGSTYYSHRTLNARSSKDSPWWVSDVLERKESVLPYQSLQLLPNPFKNSQGKADVSNSAWISAICMASSLHTYLAVYMLPIKYSKLISYLIIINTYIWTLVGRKVWRRKGEELWTARNWVKRDAIRNMKPSGKHTQHLGLQKMEQCEWQNWFLFGWLMLPHRALRLPIVRTETPRELQIQHDAEDLG